MHCQNTFQWNISFTVKIHLSLVFTTCKRNGEDPLIIIPSDLILAGKKLFLLLHYAVSGVIFCVNERSTPEGSQTDRALYSSLPFRLCRAQGAPLPLPFILPWSNERQSLCPCCLSPPPCIFSRGIIRVHLSSYSSLKQKGI